MEGNTEVRVNVVFGECFLQHSVNFGYRWQSPVGRWQMTGLDLLETSHRESSPACPFESENPYRKSLVARPELLTAGRPETEEWQVRPYPIAAIGRCGTNAHHFTTRTFEKDLSDDV